jgi:hypothetical protein
MTQMDADNEKIGNKKYKNKKKLREGDYYLSLSILISSASTCG